MNSDAFDGIVIQKTSGPGTGEVVLEETSINGSLSLSLVFHLGPTDKAIHVLVPFVAATSLCRIQ